LTEQRAEAKVRWRICLSRSGWSSGKYGKKLLAISRLFDVSSASSGDVGCPFVDTIKAENTLGRGRCLPKAMVEPALGLAVMQGTIEGVAFCRICGGRWPRSGSGEVELVPRLRPASGEA
jgi:hypothetical protein